MYSLLRPLPLLTLRHPMSRMMYPSFIVAEQRRSNRYSLITIRDKGLSVAGIDEPTEPVSDIVFPFAI